MKVKSMFSKVYTNFVIWLVKKLPKTIRYWVIVHEGVRYSTRIDTNITPSEIKYFDLLENVV